MAERAFVEADADVRIGVGGALHDFSAAVWADGGLKSLVRAQDVVGLPHGVDTAAMYRLFDREPDARRAVGRWVNDVRSSGVVVDVVHAAREAAGVGEREVRVVAHSCPAVLLPPLPSARQVPVDHLSAHAAGVLEARQGDRVLVLDVLGDRGEVAAAFEVSGGLHRLWTVHEPSSIGVLLDGVALLNGLDPLDRETADLFAAPEELPALAGETTALGYTVQGMKWRTMVHRGGREEFLRRVVGDADATARRRLAAAAIGVSTRLSGELVDRLAVPDHVVWLAGDVFLHDRLSAAARLPARRCRLPGDDGVAVGCAAFTPQTVRDDWGATK